MNIYALVAGIAMIAYVIFRFRKTGLERSKWAYPLLLASFPLYYLAFALYANDLTALGKEILFGIFFIGLSLWAIRSSRKKSALLIGSGSILHGLYDVYHDIFFINPGTPDWWFEFCGSIDIILGVYLIYFATTLSYRAVKQKSRTASIS